MSDQQFGVGVWRTRGGEKAVVERITDSPYDGWPLAGWINNDRCSWAMDGHYGLRCDGPYDLVGPWGEPETIPDVREKCIAALEHQRSALAKIVSTQFGWDGDCGVIPIADKALDTVQEAIQELKGESDAAKN